MLAKFESFLGEAPAEQEGQLKNAETMIVKCRTIKMEYNLGRVLVKKMEVAREMGVSASPLSLLGVTLLGCHFGRFPAELGSGTFRNKSAPKNGAERTQN